MESMAAEQELLARSPHLHKADVSISKNNQRPQETYISSAPVHFASKGACTRLFAWTPLSRKQDKEHVHLYTS